jgi:RHS repeat-associated protein
MEMPNWVDGNGHNNGTLQGTTILAGGPDLLVNLPQYQQTFGYDGLNRLTSASESSADGSWTQTYQYDAWGNMWMPNNSLGAPAIGPGAPTANVYSASGPGKNRNVNSTYDTAGNLTLFGSMNVSYDAENRQIVAGATSYFYDGVGQRVKKIAPSGTTVYVYDAFGQLAAEYASGLATGSACGSTCYLSYDLLGSVRMVTDGQHNVVARHDYAPFGQEIPAGVGGRTSVWAASDSVNQKFTGYERDGETSLDFAQARYMSAGLGRFMSADPGNAGADFTNPQSWNAYAYVLGNPLNSVDPTGMDTIIVVCVNPASGETGQPQCHTQGPTVVQAIDPILPPSQYDASNPGKGPTSGLPGGPAVNPGGGGGSAAAAATTAKNIKRLACSADVAINFGLGFIPGYNAVKIAVALAGINFNPFEAALNNESVLTAGLSPIQAAAGALSAYSFYRSSLFDAAGGASALNRLTDLAGRASFAEKSAAAQASLLGKISSLSNLGKVASSVGTVPNLLNVASAGFDLYNCLGQP